MFLKSLELKGFKSFADKTLLELEPGVTVVIGPNGSGKSNVVDAVAWVLGAQGARALRGGKMDDVIFAGTASRPALGRAEVSLTIDNASGALPIEFSEVTITRRLFRTGDSEYELNGAPCRLLDIQELLSDSGIGRQQHVIVGQGQLDQVLNARPEDRRAIIEEAAGVLKFRKRKERAERRLEATEANLLRLNDLLREVRRQLRPLERQADAARRYDGLVDELRSVRLFLIGRDLEQLQARLDRNHAQRGELRRVDGELRAALRDLDTHVLAAERALSLPGDDRVADLLLQVEQLRERGRGLQALLGERARGIERELAAAADEGVVETLVADAAAATLELSGVEGELATLGPELAAVETAERDASALRRELDDGAAVAADLTPGGRERQAAQASVEAAAVALRDCQAECDALERTAIALQRDEPNLRAELAQGIAELAKLDDESLLVEREEHAAEAARATLAAEMATPAHETEAGREQSAAELSFETASARLTEAQVEAGHWRARAVALALALDETRRASGGEAIRGLGGVIGPVIENLEIDAGTEVAVAAALGDALHAVVLDGTASARAAVAELKRGDGAALLLVLDARAHAGAPEVLVPPGTRPLAQFVHAPRAALEAAVRRLLAHCVLADDWSSALDVALRDPGIVAVTPQGDRFGGGSVWRAGAAGGGAVTKMALDEAEQRASSAEAEFDAAAASVHSARERLTIARENQQRYATSLNARRVAFDASLGEVTARRHDLERRRAGLAERRSQLSKRLSDIADASADIPTALVASTAALQSAETELEQARHRLAAARRNELVDAEARRNQRAELVRLTAVASNARREYAVRVAAIKERRAVLTRRLGEVEARLAARPDEEAVAQSRRAALTEKRAAVAALSEHLGARLVAAQVVGERLREQRRAQSEAARAASSNLEGLRRARAAAEQQLGEERERLQRIEVEDAETKLRLETAIEQLRRDFDCEADVARRATQPEVPENTTLPQRARELERELRLLGPINPLALTEYEALLERHDFLQQQLDDVKTSRRELNRVIQAVNIEIIAVFDQAFTDVSRHFEELFALLFPGGSGRLNLLDPDDLLNTGIEVEARPSGKTVRRLSLLSGGERSLVALAFLFAVFRARPSPFYLLDEVEAALDDVNLHRFLDLLSEFRSEAQLLVVSHQKRTMEAGDVLYGVSMPPGGSSRVVSQRVRDLEFETS